MGSRCDGGNTVKSRLTVRAGWGLLLPTPVIGVARHGPKLPDLRGIVRERRYCSSLATVIVTHFVTHRLRDRPRSPAVVRGFCRRAWDRLPAMTELGPVAWPPAPISTERLVLRQSEAGDRGAFIALLASPEVGTYLGGPQPRDELEHAMPEVPGRRPGFFVVDLDGAMIGTITFDRATGHIRPAAGEAELGYMFLPEAWGCGYAAEACAAALDWFAGALPREPVVLATQTANVRAMRLAAKLGFTEVERFEDYGAEQWFGVWSSVTPSA
jgi:RimJ/RimL family protein N-acetyltransferase